LLQKAFHALFDAAAFFISDVLLKRFCFTLKRMFHPLKNQAVFLTSFIEIFSKNQSLPVAM